MSKEWKLSAVILQAILFIYSTDPTYGCITGVVRLVDGSYTYQGRVEICVNNTWGTVCDDDFDSSDARVVCRQLGYSSVTTYYSSPYYGQRTGPIWLEDLGCSGSELTLLQCSHPELGIDNCDHSEDVDVDCSGNKTGSCTNGDVHLVNGTDSTSGHVEVCANNQWGTVCDDYWDNNDAKVVCRMLNYPSSGAIAKSFAYFGQGSGSILLDDVQCTGNEVSIFSCSNNSIGSHNCSHSEDAGVFCLDDQYNMKYIFIACIQFIQYNDAAGCVDICHSNATCQNINGTYKCICNSGFTGNGTFCEVDCYENCKRKLLALVCHDIEKREEILPMPCKT